MTFTAFEIRPGAYYDSVVLMQLQRGLLDLPGVLDTGVVMATPANCALLSQSDLFPSDAGSVGSEDLLIVVRAKSKAEAEGALAEVDGLLSRRRVSEGSGFNPRSLDAAAKMLPDSKWMLVSVPGRYAAKVVRDALQLGKHVFLYSDNVSLEDEIKLKRQSSVSGLLVMGPDCGTALIRGVGFGFANRVRRGPVGLVGAAGTGLQAILSKIHHLGSGVSHAIGTGGRDLKSEVGGITALQGLDLLQRDPETQVIVLVSKPPDPDVAAKLLAKARDGMKPVVVQFMGYAPMSVKRGNLYFANNFSEAASKAVDLLQGEPDNKYLEVGDSIPSGRRQFLRGLYSGGSLANEALRALQVSFSPLYSNVPLYDAQRLPDPFKSQAHTILDLGSDEFTVGRLHPMMDNALRLRLIRQEASDPEVAVILMDVVLGEGAHPDPASELAPVVVEVREQYAIEVVVILVGTDEDPQDLEDQRRQFVEAGARVFDDTLHAIGYIDAKFRFEEGKAIPPVSLETIEKPVSAINIGLESFYDSLISQGASAVHVDWQPPAGGDDELLSILEKMRS
jgi:FdrA protein